MAAAAAVPFTDLSKRGRPTPATGTGGATSDFRELLQSCPDAIWIQCNDHVVFANRAAHRMFRAGSGSALLGMHWQRLVAPACWADAAAHCSPRAAEVGAHVAQLEINYLTLDGVAIAAESTSVLVAFDGRPAVLVTVHDISARRAAEQDLREQRVKLEQLVLERTADLRQALADARLSDQAKDAFLANVSHELRTPLGGIIGLLELALPRCRDATLRAYLEKASYAGKHLSRIINDLLDLSKVVAGRITLEAIPFRLNELLQRVRDVIAHQAEAKGLRLQFRADGDIPGPLVGDPTRIEQILLNLTGNAIKFTSAGEIDVHVSLVARSEVQVRLSIDITDSGIGMTAEEISGLFQPFSQASAATSRNFGGTGLGLALSQHLAEAMGGRITVSSRKGHGSVFSLGLSLPLAGAPQAEPLVAATPANYHQARVLLVEDDPLNAEIVSELLQAVGIYPQLAGNGHEAVAMLAEEGPAAYDLVLMDVQMPVLDGHAATRLIRSWSGFAALPIVAMTAHALEHERRNSLAAGMNDHIGKPFDHASFYAMLDKWLPWGATATAPDTSSPVAAKALPELRCLDVAAGLQRFSGNEQRYRHWLARFVEESPEVAPELRRLLASGATEKALAATHSFKGSAGTLGLEVLATRAAELEQAIRQRRDAVPELRQLERAIDEARREIIASFGL